MNCHRNSQNEDGRSYYFQCFRIVGIDADVGVRVIDFARPTSVRPQGHPSRIRIEAYTRVMQSGRFMPSRVAGALRFLRDAIADSDLPGDEILESFVDTVARKQAISKNRLGLAYVRNEQYEEAEALFTEAIRLNPYFGEAFTNRATARRNLGKQQEAEQDLQSAKELQALERDTADRGGSNGATGPNGKTGKNTPIPQFNREVIAGKTIMTFDRTHGTRVEYHVSVRSSRPSNRSSDLRVCSW